MWDGGTAVQASAYLAGLAGQPTVTVNPSELADLGIAEGEKVAVASHKGSVTVVAVADPGVPEGIAVIPWNLPGARVSELIDAGDRLNVVHISPGGDN